MPQSRPKWLEESNQTVLKTLFLFHCSLLSCALTRLLFPALFFFVMRTAVYSIVLFGVLLRVVSF